MSLWLISDLSQVKEVTQEIKETYKTIDILVNNAGVWTDDELEENNPELRQKAFDTNALGNIQCIEEILPLFKKQKSGQICTVISGAGIESGDNTLWKTYGATKWAMTGYTKALRESLAVSKMQ